MQVTSYQMHHVLNCFCKKLGRTGQAADRTGRGEEKRVGDEASLTPGTVREAAREKITREIFQKIAGAGVTEASPPPVEGVSEGRPETPAAEARFTYDVIAPGLPKRRATLAGGDARSLIRRLAQLESPAPPARTDSWI